MLNAYQECVSPLSSLRWNPESDSIGMIKKWLEALRGEAFTERTFSYFLQAFKSFLNDSLSADSMRSLSLYITYAIHKPKPLSILPSRGKSIRSTTDLLSRRKDVGDSVTHQSTATHDENSTLTQSRVAFRILEMYTALLCNKNDLANIKRFARTVTNKVNPSLTPFSNLY